MLVKALEGQYLLYESVDGGRPSLARSSGGRLRFYISLVKRKWMPVSIARRQKQIQWGSQEEKGKAKAGKQKNGTLS
jgi:hypothetical protein